MIDPHDDTVIPDVVSRISERLAARYAGTVSAETVSAIVDDSYRQLAARASIRRYLASLTGHFAAERLAAIRRASVSLSDRPASVLFVCVENAGRSQLASALLAAELGDGVTIASAGSQPGSAVSPLLADALDELGVPLGTAYPKPLTDELVRGADFVITMGCGDACPVYPGRKYEDWAIPAPDAVNLDSVRAARDAIAEHVRTLAAEIRAARAHA